MNVFVIIPARNEAVNIESTLKSLIAAGWRQLVVVDDGSTDRTAAIAASLAIVLRHPLNRGQGAALATGTHYALSHGAEIIVHFDADGQQIASEIGRMVQPIIDGQADIVLGSRFLQPNDIPVLKKWLILKPAIAIQRMTTGLALTDVHNGFRALNRKAAGDIEIEQDGMAHASEIVAKIKKYRLRYCEKPVTVLYRRFGQGLGAGMKIYRDLIFKKLSE